MLYFAYGANTHRAAMAYRCPEAEFLGTARLTGYVLTFRGVADVVPRHDGTVYGALWDITDTDLEALDRFEGYPRLYTRSQVTFAPSRTVRPVVHPSKPRAWIYAMTPGHTLGAPSPSYLETLREGYADCGLPSCQLEEAVLAASGRSDRRGYVSQQWAS